ncbi:hypothetical protein PSN45_001103 [Yamadazyma tenuis]|uniref:Armadillo-like helical domain-containing protein n=1 Tax=Candida tenuis (strain ATCC 10573 / BCRC 21748 / CBS 615 / JCM 9827 / NBRC 10315 / NRRL Y-1498 / VKM Y-70) TaxID=590646 RepID=G3B8D1_CANTC|nr:uncharacterized protein CANTEDRAFT_115828 [Yamadazyma tenuis ATCC 10573]EGV62368.1 hypothetical protein CANTEDRAFT_115828 [Yamadazyma tenuis ATCC 10573]WEJ93634.1 hypothetical protein PSN45_001103 [Yamadazyma tenuis]
MNQQTIQLYGQIFINDSSKIPDFYKTFYSTLVHFESLKSTLVANLSATHLDSDADVNQQLISLFNHGIAIFKEVSQYTPTPLSTSNGMSRDHLEEDDITNIKPKPMPLLLNAVFNDMDDELRFELIANVLRILRVILSSVVECHKQSELVVTDRIDYSLLFRMVYWFLERLVPNLDLEKVNQTLLVIMKEIVYLVYDYMVVITVQNTDMLNEFRRSNYADLLNQILIKTHPNFANNILDTRPTVSLSTKTQIRVFVSLGILNNDNQVQINYSDEDKFAAFLNQFEPLLQYSIKVCYDYNNDLTNHQIMNASFFNWMTANLLNFSNEYLNDSYIRNIYINNDDIESLLNIRIKQYHNFGHDYFESLEFFPISLYINGFCNQVGFLEKFLETDAAASWLCLASYVLTYQFKSKKSVLATRLVLHMYDKFLKSPNILSVTINEFKWKLCHQRAPILPFNKANNKHKPWVSYMLDNLVILLRFNLNRKLNVPNFVNAIKLITLIVLTHVDENYHYEDLFKSMVNLLNFNETHLNSREIRTELLQSFEIALGMSIRSHLVYHVLLMFDKFEPLSLEGLPNLTHLKTFIMSKFDIKGDDPSKIKLLDSDFESPELQQTIKQFGPVAKTSTLVPKVKIGLNDIIVNL